MKSLIATTLLLCSDAGRQTMEEDSSLMQGLLTRHSQLTAGTNTTQDSRKDITAKLMQSATDMMKNGATPDVVKFIESTINEVETTVLGAILREHTSDQSFIDVHVQDISDAVLTMEECAGDIGIEIHYDEERYADMDAHKTCRAEEALACASSRKCEKELIVLWNEVTVQEKSMMLIHSTINDGWCEADRPDPDPWDGPVPDHPDNDEDPFNWKSPFSKEGPETSQSLDADYPLLTTTSSGKEGLVTLKVVHFRSMTKTHFESYKRQKVVVENAWIAYNLKLATCAGLEIDLENKVSDCDDLQTTFRSQSCAHDDKTNCVKPSKKIYQEAFEDYEESKVSIEQKEHDRMKEWETLHVITCLLKTVYTRVIHSIESGEPCPTEESDPVGTQDVISGCHVLVSVEHLKIDYGTPPQPPALPDIGAPPCTPQYLWDDHGEFPPAVRSQYLEQLSTGELSEENTQLLDAQQWDWAGCAAPLACIPCHPDERTHIPDIAQYYITDDGNGECGEDQAHLTPGQLDTVSGSFKCKSGEQCIRASQRCDGVPNCNDASDEWHCTTPWGAFAVLNGEETCLDTVPADIERKHVQFKCGPSPGGPPGPDKCIPIEGLCNGYSNCGDKSDEAFCTGSVMTPPLASSGFLASVSHLAIDSKVFSDRDYEFETLGSFEGKSYVLMHNDDKHTPHSHVQMKLTLQEPMTIYIVKRGKDEEGRDHAELPWLATQRWVKSSLQGVTYKGHYDTRHHEWDITRRKEKTYGPGDVWEKTFPAGTVEIPGSGGDGSYLVFFRGAPVSTSLSGSEDQCLGTYEAESATQQGATRGGTRVWLPNTRSDEAFIEWSVSDCGGGQASISFHYATRVKGTYFKILVNGEEVMARLSFPSTSSWSEFEDVSVTVPLRAGSNTIKVRAAGQSGDKPYFDYLTIGPSTTTYVLGDDDSSSCRTPLSSVSKAECQSAGQSLLPVGQPQTTRTMEVVGSQDALSNSIPTGCSVLALTVGEGDWAVTWNSRHHSQEVESSNKIVCAVAHDP